MSAWDDLKKDVRNHVAAAKKLQDAYVTIGVHNDAGNYPDGTEVVSVALWMEFGTKRARQRSFIRSTVDGAEAQINSWREDLLGKVLDGKLTVEKALDKLGLRVRLLIENKIKSNVPPPLAKSTEAAKRRAGVATSTLINTGLLLRSIAHRVHL